MGERVNIHKAKVHCDCIFNNQRTEFFQRKISGAKTGPPVQSAQTELFIKLKVAWIMMKKV